MKSYLLIALGFIIGISINSVTAYELKQIHSVDIASGWQYVNAGMSEGCWWLILKNQNRYHLVSLPKTDAIYELIEEGR